MDISRRRILKLKRKFKKEKTKLKGSFRDPFFCLGLSAISLFILVALGVGPMLNAANNNGDFALAMLTKTLEEKAGSSFLGQTQNSWAGSQEFLLVGDSSVKPSTPPTVFSPQVLAAMSSGTTNNQNRGITEYVVGSGDTLSGISKQFNISVDTILWANDLNKGAYIQPGQTLVIPPVTGVIHHVKTGDTVSGIAQKYDGKANEIIVFNNLSGEGDVFVGDILIVPNGEIPAPSAVYAPAYVPIADSYFICPISAPCRITQGPHWYNAIDFSHGKCGEPIYAAAAGTVLKVKLTNSTSKWAFGGAGNHLTILHPNGVVTMYGHLANSFVNPGDTVSQGQVIALMGGQPGTAGAGLSTGCHVHFGVSGARNPFAR